MSSDGGRRPGGGVLVLVATPIGNFGDLSPRAVDELAGADLVACEDTRKAGKLLEHAGVKARQLLAVHDHNETERADAIVERLDRGERVVLISDAGMPGISDPGERLVRAVVAAGHEVDVVPGPSAALAAVVVSGLPAGRFVFEGFLPRKGSGRGDRLEQLRGETRTMVFYEAPHRIARTVADLSATFGVDRPVVLARELTKTHQEVWRGTLGEAAARVGEGDPRGEYVVVLGGVPAGEAATDADIAAALQREIEAGHTTRDAVASVAAVLGVPRRRVYDLANRR
jgi:16S rRNA (cytidine1402-2'-O)-methyltransferase